MAKQIKYIGNFISAEGNNFIHEVYCNGFLQAFFLLTADAIRSAKHYQLHTITDEENNVRFIDNINNCSELIKTSMV